MRVVGEAETGREALALVAEHRPDLLLLDVQLPGMSGVAVAARVSRDYPDVRILVYTGYDDEPARQDLLALGVRGYLRKPASLATIADAARKVVAGESVLDANAAPRALPRQVIPLTGRQREVLRHVAHGLSNATIAARLHVTVKTVEHHVALVREKLPAVSRVDLANQARLLALV